MSEATQRHFPDPISEWCGYPVKVCQVCRAAWPCDPSKSESAAGDSVHIDPQPDAWEIEEGVRCVSCPRCAFTFDAIHADDAAGEYSCPSCEEAALLTQLAEQENKAKTVREALFDVSVRLDRKLDEIEALKDGFRDERDTMQRSLTDALNERESLRGERDVALTQLAAARTAALALLNLHIPYAAYALWRQTGDDSATDALQAYDDALAALRTAILEVGDDSTP